jgi:AcrR family transcriptional regulator
MDQITRRERERLVREGEIVAAAEKIFGLKGFEEAAMDEIALEAQFTKRTLYFYFNSKEELFFAAALKSYKHLFTCLTESSVNTQTGFMKLFLGSQAFLKFAKECPGTMRLICETGQVKKKAEEGSQRLKELMEFDNEMFYWAARVIEEGKADGSIKNDLDSVKASFSIIFMMTGFFNQLSMTGETFLAHFALDLESFSDYSMNLLFTAIKKQSI